MPVCSLPGLLVALAAAEPALALALALQGGWGQDPQSLWHCWSLCFLSPTSRSFPHTSSLAPARPGNGVCLLAALSFCQELFPLFRSNRLLK